MQFRQDVSRAHWPDQLGCSSVASCTTVVERRPTYLRLPSMMTTAARLPGQLHCRSAHHRSAGNACFSGTAVFKRCHCNVPRSTDHCSIRWILHSACIVCQHNSCYSSECGRVYGRYRYCIELLSRCTSYSISCSTLQPVKVGHQTATPLVPHLCSGILAKAVTLIENSSCARSETYTVPAVVWL